MSRSSTPPAVVQRAIDLADDLGDSGHVTNVSVDRVGDVGVETPTPTVAGSTYIFDGEETFHIDGETCSCGEGEIDLDTIETCEEFDEVVCEHIRSALDARPFNGICECGHAEYHSVDIYAGGEPATDQPRCTYCNRGRRTEFQDEANSDHYVEHSGRILTGPMSQTEAHEFVVEESALNVTREDALEPICPECGTATEVAVRSSNITGRLCPVCDDPTVEFAGD